MCTLDIIKSLLKSQKKTQQDLCLYLGVSKQAFTEWNGGRNTSYKKYLPQIADYFGVTVDYLLGRENKSEKPTEISDELWDALRADSQKKQLALWLTQLPDSEFERVKQLLGAALLLPPE